VAGKDKLYLAPRGQAVFVKAALRQGLSEVETPPKAAAKATLKQLHFHSYIDIDSNSKKESFLV
jgi:hypothetical protein